MEEFIGMVEDELKRQGMTLSELSRRAKIARPYLHRILAGRHSPSLEWAEKVAHALGLTLTFKKVG